MRKTIQDHKEDLINELDAARQSLLSVVKTLPAEAVDAPCIGTWCIKDLLAHLVGWDYTNLQAVQEILDGKRPAFLSQYDPDWQTYNARLVVLHRKEDLSELLGEVDESHKQLVVYLRSLPARDLMNAKSPREQGRPVTVRNLIHSEASDERKHAEEVQAFLAKKSF